MISPGLIIITAIVAVAVVTSLLVVKDRYVVMCVSMLFGALVMTIIITSDPQAIDVYNGKAVLKVSYDICEGDTIATDSTVIWKWEK